jgi:hypothetical protein
MLMHEDRSHPFWNWTPDGDSQQVADPLLEREADGDLRLFLSAKSPVRAAGKGNFESSVENR